jgi:hypothetical protein
MQSRSFWPVVILSLSVTAVVSGQRALQSNEVLEIFKKLTSQPRETWIPAGTIEATHREYREPKITNSTVLNDEISKQVQGYKSNPNKVELTDELQKMKLAAIPFNVRFKLANKYTMDSTEVVKYDGERFYWETDVGSRQDSVAPDSALAGNFMTEQFDLGYNRKRVSAWDTQAYVTYTVSGKFATVDAAGRLPRAVNGPLTAGLVPWGYGRLSYDSLRAAASSATELSLNGKSQILLSLDWADGLSATLTLDPSKDYAVTACTLPAGKGEVSVNDYDDYRQVAGRWVPAAVYMERRDATTGKLLGSDRWTFVAIDGTVPDPDSFTVKYEPNTYIQYISNLITEPTTYLYSDSMDMDRLLADRLAYIATEGKQPQNCATAAAGYVASRLGKAVPDSALAALVQPDGGTTLYDVKQLVQRLGLYCKAVQADLATLQSLGHAKVILHVPSANHFVVLDSIDDRGVQIVDLSGSKFCYRDTIDSFKQRWPQGLALLVSSTPIGGTHPDVDDANLTRTVGGTYGWTCTKRIQTTHWYYCQEPCQGWFTYFWARYGCELVGSGNCGEAIYCRYQERVCIFDPIKDCTTDGDWYFYWMYACS